MPITDKFLLNDLKDICSTRLQTHITGIAEKPNDLTHPLDGQILKLIEKISLGIGVNDDEYRIFYYDSEIKDIWRLLIEKSIKCLRSFDENEPFLEYPSKQPICWGIDELESYFKKYCEFERMLYGNKHYRDHVIHVFRVWILGVHCLFSNNASYIEEIKVDPKCDVNILEKLSIWTIIALTHDLGYPLEKVQTIVETTKDMMKSFIINPNISMDLAFNEVQARINDFILRFMSSKMIKRPETDGKSVYVSRLQPKYYFKFQKSLENKSHGIISAIIIYKILTYFLESDFNINEDYTFDKREARQFYIRREILRAISTHTCSNVYHLTMNSLSLLLIISDDCQEWGRKQIDDLYVKPQSTYELNNIKFAKDNNDINICTIEEEFSLKAETDELKRLLKNVIGGVWKKYEEYRKILRDGPDTIRRDFNFCKKTTIKCTGTVKYTIETKINKEEDSELSFKIETSSVEQENSFGEEFIKKLLNGKGNIKFIK